MSRGGEVVDAALRGWLPVRIAREGAESVVTWRPVGSSGFTEPFFGDTLRATAGEPGVVGRRMRTGAGRLREVAEDPEGGPVPEVAGLVFHASRCGSTLLSRLLAAVSREHLVFSEAEPIDFVVRWPLHDPRVGPIAQSEHLRWLVAAMGRAVPGRRRVFLKLDAWHIRSWRLFEAAFPRVPWVFLYRAPLEILVSHARQPGAHMLAGAVEPAYLGLDPEGYFRWSTPVRRARVLAALGESALEGVAHGGGRLLRYEDLVAGEHRGWARWFGIPPWDLSDPEVGALRRVHAKEPGREFLADSGEKRMEAGPELRAAVEDHVEAVHWRLEDAWRRGFGLVCQGGGS